MTSGLMCDVEVSWLKLSECVSLRVMSEAGPAASSIQAGAVTKLLDMHWFTSLPLRGAICATALCLY